MAPRFAPALLIGALLALANPALAQPSGIPVKRQPADYQTRVAVQNGATIAADYLVATLPAANSPFILKDHLVVEIAVFPQTGRRVEIAPGLFRLRLNGNRKEDLLPASPGSVAAAQKYPDWNRNANVQVGAGVGDAGVIVGRPRPVERFPGDQRPRTRLPNPPGTSAGKVEAEDTKAPADWVVESALPEGSAGGPVAGYLYFPYRGKLTKIRSVELLVETGSGPAVLNLR